MRGAEFLSTPSVRRATASQVRPPKLLDISIHALREEGDCLIVRQRGPAQDFYPRPPRGGRRSAPLFRPSSRNYFYPRPPRGGRRQARSGRQVAQDISIHALREEGDLGSPWVSVGFSEFLSTPSARRATDTFLIFCRQMQISIHALREEGDHRSLCRSAQKIDFYPRPPRGGRR